MSERKSWDVQPARRPAPAPAPIPKRQVQAPPQPRTVEKPKAKPQAPVRTVTKTPLPTGTLKQRRQKKRRAVRYVSLGICALLLVVSMYVIWMPTFRIQAVHAEGPGADISAQVMRMKMQGAYWFIIPRNSVFFFPMESMRKAILDANPEASAVSIKRTSFSSVNVLTTTRAASFLWCGTSVDTALNDCYESDIEGRIFKKADSQSQATTSTSSARFIPQTVRVFGALDRDVANGISPVRGQLVMHDRIPNALRFVDSIRELKAPVTALEIHEDEGRLWLNGPVYITYVLGHEEEAAQLAASALPSISLTSGTVRYIDLRFPGKAYIGKYGESE